MRCIMSKCTPQKFQGGTVIRGERGLPLDGWINCMRNFTKCVEFDDTLPIAEGMVESELPVTQSVLRRLRSVADQRGKGDGQGVRVEISKLAEKRTRSAVRGLNDSGCRVAFFSSKERFDFRQRGLYCGFADGDELVGAREVVPHERLHVQAR